MRTREPVACAASAVVLQDGEAPRRIQLLPMGKFTAAGWGEFEVADRADAERIIAATRQRLGATELMGDYDHQLIYATGKGNGGQALASGWINPATLSVQDDGIWGEVAWTPLAEQRLADREYRYISPAILPLEGGRIDRLVNFALVNTPAIKELAAAAAENLEGPDMKKIAAALGLSEDATEDAICAAIGDLKTKGGEAAQQLVACGEALGLASGASAADIVAAAQAKAGGEPDPKLFAPISMVQDLQRQLGEVVTAGAKEKAEAAVDDAIKAGKIQPAHRAYWVGNASADLAAFNDYVAAAAVIVPLGERVAPGAAPGAGDVVALSDADKSLCARMGWDEAAFLEQLKKDRA